MLPERIDHVALWVPERRTVAARVQRVSDVRVLEEGEDFTLLGNDLELGKLTLFDAQGPREESQLMHVALREPGGEEWEDVEVAEPLHLLRLRADDAETTDLDHVALRVADPETSATQWSELGFERTEPRVEQSVRMRLGDTYLELYPGTPLPTEKPLLNHVGLRVESVDPYVEGTADIGLDVLETVDGEHSRSVFVQGPDEVKVELIQLETSAAK